MGIAKGISHGPVFLGIGLALVISSAMGVAAIDYTKRVRFPRGKSRTEIKNAVVRGDRDRYLIGASAGQHLEVRISSLESNAVFSIADGKSGNELPGAEEGADRTRWSGRLPRTGDYVITVGGTRGNASYTLKLSIR